MEYKCLLMAEFVKLSELVYLEDNLRFLISKDKCLQDDTYIDVEYAANEERQLLEKVAACRFKCWKERTGYNHSEWSTRKCCRASGYFETDVLASRVLPKFKSSTPDYLLFTKPITDAPKSVIDDIKKYVDVVYVSRFTIETFSMMSDFYSDPYTELISFIAVGISGAITDNPKNASAFITMADAYWNCVSGWAFG
uniref:Uncharacterized protein n=1 Tax=Tanacetum cinerariifolium TaxID=118510 RepID=A0A6L2JQV9_TANCI|nr:hypothetical protein [Tanacetum cinerariifolium]